MIYANHCWDIYALVFLYWLVGVYPVRPPVPAVGGYEGVGEVHSVGSAVQGLSPGDLVIASPPSPGKLLLSRIYFDINVLLVAYHTTKNCAYISSSMICIIQHAWEKEVDGINLHAYLVNYFIMLFFKSYKLYADHWLQNNFFLGTWQTHVVKDESFWHKFDRSTPIEYAATVTVNPLTALRMMEDYMDLKSGATISGDTKFANSSVFFFDEF